MKAWLSRIFVNDKAFYKKLLLLAVPVVLQQMITVGVSIMDTVMLSSLAEEQISASSLAGSYLNFFHIICMGLGGGITVMASQFYGEKDMVSFRRVMTLMIRISFVVGVLATLVTMVFPRQIMSIYTSEELVIEYGIQYLEVVGFSMLFMLLTIPVTLILRSAGKANVPLYSAIGAFILNIVCNYIFIFGKFGAPRMEIAGAALGTVISYAFQLVFVFVYVFCIEKRIGYRIKHLFEPVGSYIRSFLHYGLPVLISDSILGLGMNVVSIIMGHIGGGFVAAYAIISTMMRLSTTFTQGCAVAGGVLIGNTLGEGDREKAYRQGLTCSWISVGLGLIVAGVLLVVGVPYISMYNISESTREIALELLYAASLNALFMNTGNMLTKGVLRGGGDTRWLMVMDVVFLWAVSIPLGALAGLVWHLSPFVIYTFLRLDPVLKSIAGFIRLYSKKWINIVKAKA